MPAMAPPDRPEEGDDCCVAGADVEDAVEAADVGVEEAGVVVAVVEATWATPKAKPSYG